MNASDTPAPVAVPISNDIVSVNPGSLTLGALHPEGAKKLLRRSARVFRSQTSSRGSLAGFFFASAAPGVVRYAWTLLVMRMLFAALTGVSGSFILCGEIQSPACPVGGEVFAWIELVTAASIALGFLTRWGALTAAVAFGWISVNAVMDGIFDMGSLCLTFASVAFVLLGGGKWSVDGLLRRGLVKMAIRRRNRHAEARMTYKAFRNV